MNISCTICSDLLIQAADKIYITQCGHVFHYMCLKQWMDRSKSCPQCRSEVTHNCISPVYPAILDEDTVVTKLQSRLDDAQLQINKQQSSHKVQREKLANAELELKKNLKVLKVTEKELADKEAVVEGLKEKLEIAITRNGDVQKLKEENDILKKNLQNLNGLQQILNEASAKVDQMLEDHSDLRTVATIATTLRSMSECAKNEFRERLRVAEEELSTEKICTTALQARIVHLEDQLINMHRNKRKSDGELPADAPESHKYRRAGAEGGNNVIIAYHNGPKDCRYVISLSPLGGYEATYFGDVKDAGKERAAE